MSVTRIGKVVIIVIAALLALAIMALDMFIHGPIIMHLAFNILLGVALSFFVPIGISRQNFELAWEKRLAERPNTQADETIRSKIENVLVPGQSLGKIVTALVYAVLAAITSWPAYAFTGHIWVRLGGVFIGALIHQLVVRRQQ
ncbi:MAG: hypothetical protein ACYC27_09790 [Armatimonadota bacterium]